MAAPTILIPGIKGTKLVNVNKVQHDTVWSGIQSKYEDIQELILSNDGLHDKNNEVIIQHGEVEHLAYHDFVSYIQDKTESPVYIFGYDWRLSFAVNARRLKDFVDHVAQKTNSQSFNFVSHSMGGLIFCTYLTLLSQENTQQANNFNIIDHAVFCACPFLGSVRALVALIRGEGGLPVPFFNSNNHFRKVARSFPSIYEALPFYGGAVRFADDHPNAGQDVDLCNIQHWQNNILKNYPNLNDRLAELKKLRDGEGLHLKNLRDIPAGIRERFVILHGTGEDTKRHVTVEYRDGFNFFNFDQEDKNGDGTVALESGSCYKDIILTLTVEKRPVDLGFHPLILNDTRVQTVIKRFICGDTSMDNWWADWSGSINSVSNNLK